mmetsp:Transcript_286/g.1320  ORF Transcript_286/g.1320 Transcript_286/m.1320 type:complete len:424 (-) Transcript_286:406-1677(-)
MPFDPSAAVSSLAFAPASVSGLASNARILRSSNRPTGPVIAPWSPALSTESSPADNFLFLRSKTRFIPRSFEWSTSRSRTYRSRHLDVGMNTTALFARCELGGRRRVANPIELRRAATYSPQSELETESNSRGVRSRMASIRSSLSGCVLRYRSTSFRCVSSSVRIMDTDPSIPRDPSFSSVIRRYSSENVSNVFIILGPALGSKHAPVSSRMPISSASYSIALLYGRMTASSAAASAPTIADAVTAPPKKSVPNIAASAHPIEMPTCFRISIDACSATCRAILWPISCANTNASCPSSRPHARTRPVLTKMWPPGATDALTSGESYTWRLHVAPSRSSGWSSAPSSSFTAEPFVPTSNAGSRRFTSFHRTPATRWVAGCLGGRNDPFRRSNCAAVEARRSCSSSPRLRSMSLRRPVAGTSSV